MRVRSYLLVLVGLAVLLLFNLATYLFINKEINRGTKGIISTYLNNACNNCAFTYDYLRATANNDGTLNVFIKAKGEELEKYYNFIVLNNNGYHLIDVNQNIPGYIR